MFIKRVKQETGVAIYVIFFHSLKMELIKYTIQLIANVREPTITRRMDDDWTKKQRNILMTSYQMEVILKGRIAFRTINRVDGEKKNAVLSQYMCRDLD